MAVAKARDQPKPNWRWLNFIYQLLILKRHFQELLTEYPKLGSLIDEGELLTSFQITVKCLLILMYQSQNI
jgi:hypothetical protein